ncbi:autophagy-related protein 2 homolog A isoform X2 [Podarcis raffonei]|uniref:autophagy-related protein 2 homolog A isoform X2 n=1 Tax=Podarcis raffonei TaxID=65483 RepID=UPI0023299EAB|nr:autophagy-related protein 2 homolog A isoform X2 [Podarcis raffonei]
MSRWFFPWSSSIKKRACRYLLQHYLGHFLEERLGLEQLSLDLYAGAGKLSRIHLDVWSVNEFLESVGAPLEIVDGFIDSIAVTIPWSALVTENCTVEVSGLQITCRPKYRTAAPGSESQSWASCMTTSMQLAQECLKEQAEEPSDTPQPLEGLEMFAQTIETVLRRIEVTFLDTVIRVEHVPSGSQGSVALEMHIKRLDYCDEAVKEPGQAITVDIHQPPPFVHKILQLSGVLLYYEEFAGGAGGHMPSSPVPKGAAESSESQAEEAEEEEASPSSLLQIGSCSGYTEMRIKLKQNEAFPGPKLELDGKMGSLHLLLAPQQILYLLDLLSSLNFSESSLLQEQLSKSRPLDSEDLKLIEQDLSQQLHSGLGAGPTRLEGMETCVGLENGEMFFSMAPMTSSVTSVRSASELSDIDLDSSMHSDAGTSRLQALPFAPGLMLSSPRRYGRSPFAATLPCLNKIPSKTSHPQPPSLENQRPEVLLRLTIGGLTLTLLYQTPEAPHLQLAQRFFSQLGGLKDSAFGGRDFQPLRQCFEGACPRSNVRLTGAAVQISCEHKASGQLHMFSWDASFGLLEILECLWTDDRTQAKPEYTELLVFATPSAFPYSQSPRPCARLQTKHSEKRPSSSKSRLAKVPAKQTVELVAELDDFCSDVDLATLDRLCSLLCRATTPSTPAWPPPEAHLADSPPAAKWQASVRLAAPKATLRLQFPIPDLRPWPERRPWAQKAVRQESLRLDLAGVELQVELGLAGITQLELAFSDLHGTYEGAEKLAVPCLRVGKAPDLSAKGTGKKYLLPKIALTLRPRASDTPWDLALAKPGEMELSTAESPCELKQPEPSPFSSKRTMYETEEMVIPGDPEEMAEFQSQTLEASQYALEVTFPTMHIFLPSKDFYESIYNRINNDLLMFESFSPPPTPSELLGGAGSTTAPFVGEAPAGDTRWQENFKMCKSAFKLDSDSEDEDSHFYSVDEAAQRKKGEQRSPFPQSCVSVVLSVGKGRVTALCDAKGEGGKKLEGSHGELVLDVESGSLFSVSRYKGREDLGYFCIEAEKVALYHKAVVEDYLMAEHLEISNFLPPEGLNPTIYASQEGPITWPLGSKKDGPLKMLSLAIQINLDLEKNIKEFLVTLRLEGATMRHHMALTHQSWYTQLIDFLDVLDDPILGFVPPTVITVLHTHLFSCAVDYRPLYLPIRVLITAETFTLSSNIIVDTSVFLLRFILDDSALYLSNKCDTEMGDLRRDYVCVVDVDLLELVITTFKGATTGKLTRPLFELRCSNNVVHVHTCADSCAALANLIQYVVNNGDLHPPPHHDSPTEIAGQKVQLSESPASLPSCPPAETAAINQQDLTDALIDTERSLQELAGEMGDSGLRRQPSPVSVYLFPGENGAMGKAGKTPAPPPTPVGEGLDFSPSEDSEGESEATDDFCILDAPGTGIPPRDGEPVVTKLLEGPVRIQEGHFSRPLGSTDLLKAPSRFPVPESRVMMREISVVWHLYGGRDFGLGRSASGHAHSPRTKPSLSSARSSPSRSSVTNRPQNTWRAQGGTSRIHDLLMEIQLTKVSFQHETYPSSSSSSSGGTSEKPSVELEEQPVARQVFIVQELEIRDRLASSQINKFLYLYSSECMPRRAHSNMLTIKALHVCPESGLGGPECCLRVSLMPLRLNIDQDALFFLKDFFTSVAASINPVVPCEAGSEGRPESSGKEPEGAEGEMTASMETTASENSSLSNASSSSSDQPIYFREFRFTSEVPIWLDYQGKHVTVDQVATAETVYDILSPTAPPMTRTLLDKKHTRKLRRGQQPADLREGVAKAYDTVREGVIDTAQAICDVATRGHEQKGITGAVGGVLRQIPPTVVKPLIVASEATSNLLGGMRNQIKPDARKEESLKWRSEEAQD